MHGVFSVSNPALSPVFAAFARTLHDPRRVLLWNPNGKWLSLFRQRLPTIDLLIFAPFQPFLRPAGMAAAVHRFNNPHWQQFQNAFCRIGCKTDSHGRPVLFVELPGNMSLQPIEDKCGWQWAVPQKQILANGLGDERCRTTFSWPSLAPDDDGEDMSARQATMRKRQMLILYIL